MNRLMPLHSLLSLLAVAGPVAFLLVPRWGLPGLILLTVVLGLTCLAHPSLRLSLPRPAILWLVGFVTVCLAGALVNGAPPRALWLTCTLTGLFFCWILCLANIGPATGLLPPLANQILFGIALLFGGATLDLISGGWLSRMIIASLSGEPHEWFPHDVSRGMTFGLIVLGPAFLLCLHQRRHGLAAIMLSLAAAAVFLGSHGATKLAFALGLAAAVAGYLAPSAAIPAFAIGAGLVAVTMPLLATLAFDPAGPPERLYDVPTLSIFHRLAIWRNTADLIQTAPWWGMGLDSYKQLPSQPVTYFGVTYDLINLHPHNAPLLIRLELGCPGIGLLLLVYGAVATLLWKRRAAPAYVSGALSSLAVLLVYLHVSYSLWQNWLLGAAGLAATFAVLLLEGQAKAN